MAYEDLLAALQARNGGNMMASARPVQQSLRQDLGAPVVPDTRPSFFQGEIPISVGSTGGDFDGPRGAASGIGIPADPATAAAWRSFTDPGTAAVGPWVEGPNHSSKKGFQNLVKAFLATGAGAGAAMAGAAALGGTYGAGLAGAGVGEAAGAAAAGAGEFAPASWGIVDTSAGALAPLAGGGGPAAGMQAFAPEVLEGVYGAAGEPLVGGKTLMEALSGSSGFDWTKLGKDALQNFIKGKAQGGSFGGGGGIFGGGGNGGGSTYLERLQDQMQAYIEREKLRRRIIESQGTPNEPVRPPNG